MSGALVGMLLGLAAASGLLLAVSYAPPFRSVKLVDRLAPYVHDTPPPSRLLGTATEPGLLDAVRSVFGPAVADGRPEHPAGRGEHPGLGGGAQQPGRRRGVVHVGREPVDQPDGAERRRVRDHEEKPDGTDQAEQHPGDAGGHCSTRTSWGSRPIRSISR